VKFDFSVYGAFVRKGGLILLHDIATYGRNDVGVPTLWKEIRELGLYKMEEIIGKHEAIIDAGGIGVVYK